MEPRRGKYGRRNLANFSSAGSDWDGIVRGNDLEPIKYDILFVLSSIHVVVVVMAFINIPVVMEV